ncbi:hypothetical protein Syun_013068 [Stephania yunnanensis]|uniref:Uncharacterized protein n=1 Tax=Stephania yunnanensis TaxID=152371 RepID=A0AAP0K0M2_9MAGN
MPTLVPQFPLIQIQINSSLVIVHTYHIMCICYSQAHPYGSSSNSCNSMFLVRPKRSKVRVRRLSMTRRISCDGEMELKNLKLYLENRSIIAENEKLRKRALLLHEENQALMSELQKNLVPHVHHER